MKPTPKWADPVARRQAISAGLRRFFASRPNCGIGLTELVERSRPDECPFCGEPRMANPTGRKALTCGDEVCRRAYHRYYGRTRRREVKS